MNARRRCLAAGATWPALTWMGALSAQAGAPVVIGWLDTGHADRPSGTVLRDAFIEGMAALGLKRGTQFLLEERHADGQAQRLPALAQELATKKPAVILAWPSAAAKAATHAAPTTPIVLVNGDPLASALVTNLARPDGMVTGLSNMSHDTFRKVLELLIESIPKLQRVGYLFDSTNVNRSGELLVRRALEHFRVEGVVANLAKPEDIEPEMARLAKAKIQAVAVLPSTWFNAHVTTIVRAALVHRWPVVGTLTSIPRRGGLLSYSPDGIAIARRAAHYVDRLLKGAKPADLPIERATTFNLVLNLKTARQLGIVLPQSVLIRATEVIE